MIGITIADFLGNVLEANETFLEMAGYTRDDLLAGRSPGTSRAPRARTATDRRAWEGEYRRKTGGASRCSSRSRPWRTGRPSP
ncbi:MAG: PAS domain-containing protein [Byssovorax sp.]